MLRTAALDTDAETVFLRTRALLEARGGLRLIDERDHNCCAEATVTSRLRGREVEIHEALGGKRCRCQCRSTIRTAVGLPPGKHAVTLIVEDYGERKVAFQGEVLVPRR